jgi:DNA helicase-2/ATP-dependent DNA helicase PcrA
MAILVRACKDAGPIVDALREAEIPYLGGGLNSLLDTPEAQAIREVFYFLSNHTSRGLAPVSEAALRKSLAEGFPGLTTAEIAAGIKFLQEIKKRIPLGSDNQLFLQRVFLDLLEAMSVREERIGTKGEQAK